MGANKNKRINKRNKGKRGNSHILNKIGITNTEEKNITEAENELDEPLHDESRVLKRQHNSDDSETEDQPKEKKRKKKKPLPQDGGTPAKGKKSNRQLKKEKFAQRQAEAEAATKDILKQECLNYLSQWKHARNQWKFMKVKQVWLVKNKFSSSKIPDDTWPLLLEYFDSAKGNIRKTLLEDAGKIIKQMDDCLEEENSPTAEKETTETEATTLTKPDETSYKRARGILQCLEE